MDKIWDRKSFEVGSHWPLWRGWKNQMTMQNRQRSNAKKTLKKTYLFCNIYPKYIVFSFFLFLILASFVAIIYLSYRLYILKLNLFSLHFCLSYAVSSIYLSYLFYIFKFSYFDCIFVLAILLTVFTFYLAIVLKNLQIETNNVQCLVWLE